MYSTSFPERLFDVYEVQQDSFEVYGVYHLLASARVLREKPEIIPLGAGQSQADIYEPTDFGDGPGAPQEKKFILFQSQGTRISDEEVNYTYAQQQYVRENVPWLIFGTLVPKITRDLWTTKKPGYDSGIRLNFTTVAIEEVEANDWEEYVQQGNDGKIEAVEGETYLMDFGNPSW